MYTIHIQTNICMHTYIGINSDKNIIFGPEHTQCIDN